MIKKVLINSLNFRHLITKMGQGPPKSPSLVEEGQNKEERGGGHLGWLLTPEKYQ